MPVSFRGRNNALDLSNFLEQAPILLGSIESQIKEIRYPRTGTTDYLEGRVTVAFIVDAMDMSVSPP